MVNSSCKLWLDHGTTSSFTVCFLGFHGNGSRVYIKEGSRVMIEELEELIAKLKRCDPVIDHVCGCCATMDDWEDGGLY